MENHSLGSMHRSLVSLGLALALAAGCGGGEAPPDAAAFGDYSDLWSGAIRLDDGSELPVTLSLATTDLDDEVAVDPASPYRWVFGRLELEAEGYALAVAGVVRHEAWTFEEEPEPQPEEQAGGGEFLHFFISSALGPEAPVEAYAADYAAFTARVGMIETEWHSFDLSLERTAGDALEGTFGELSTDELDADGSVVGATWKPRGAIALERAGTLPPNARPDASTLALDPFVYTTWIEDGELWWDVTIE